MERRVGMELTERERCEVRFGSGRVNLLAMLIITVANIGFFIFGKSYLVPFSASIPYYAVAYGYLPGYLSSTIGWLIAFSFLMACIVCWVRAKDDWRWLIGGFALVTIDSIALFWLLSQNLAISFWPDIIFHAWMMYYLSIGVRYGRKLERMPRVDFGEATEDQE